jgi:hypothetical protein
MSRHVYIRGTRRDIFNTWASLRLMHSLPEWRHRSDKQIKNTALHQSSQMWVILPFWYHQYLRNRSIQELSLHLHKFWKSRIRPRFAWLFLQRNEMLWDKFNRHSGILWCMELILRNIFAIYVRHGPHLAYLYVIMRLGVNTQSAEVIIIIYNVFHLSRTPRITLVYVLGSAHVSRLSWKCCMPLSFVQSVPNGLMNLLQLVANLGS